MLQKSQKTWLWVFIAMFLVPEIIFSNIASFGAYFLNGSFPSLYSLIFRGDNLSATIFLFILIIELLGALGLLAISIRKKRKIVAFILGAIVLWLVLIIYFVWGASQINLFT